MAGNNLADAIRTLAAVFASVAASAHTNNPYDQSQVAAAIFEQAQGRFGDILTKMNKRKRAELEAWLDGLVKPKR
jgi:hypothetical protein